MLNLIGIGLSHKNITEEIKDIVKKSDLAYFENYTSKYDISVKELEKILNKKLIIADRELVENSDEILKNAKTKNVSLLIIGDIFMATTHISLFLEAKKQCIKVNLIHNVSILDAVSDSGLSLYNFGKITSIPFSNENVVEPFNVLKMNRKMGLHTLFLLDLDPVKDKYMEVSEGLKYLLKRLNENEKVVVCSALGTEKQEIRYGKIKDLINKRFDKSPNCLITPGKLHFVEEEILNSYIMNQENQINSINFSLLVNPETILIFFLSSFLNSLITARLALPFSGFSLTLTI